MQRLDRKATKVSPSQLLILESRTTWTGKIGGISKVQRILIAEKGNSDRIGVRGWEKRGWEEPPGTAIRNKYLKL